MDISCYIDNSEQFFKINETKLIKIIVGNTIEVSGKNNNLIIYKVTNKDDFAIGKTNYINLEKNKDFGSIKYFLSEYIEKNKYPLMVSIARKNTDITAKLLN